MLRSSTSDTKRTLSSITSNLGSQFSSLKKLVAAQQPGKRGVRLEGIKLEPALEKSGKIGAHLEVGQTVMVQVAKEAIFDQRPAPDGRHLAGRPQRRAGAVFVEGLHFAEDPLRRREEAAQTHRAGGAAQEFRRHYPHGGDERLGRRRGTRHPFAGRQVAHGLAERQEIDGSGAAPERAEPRQYHHPRLARLVVLADYGRRRDDVQTRSATISALSPPRRRRSSNSIGARCPFSTISTSRSRSSRSSPSTCR